MMETTSFGLRDVSAWQEMSFSEKTLALVTILEKNCQHLNDSSREAEMVKKAVAAVKVEEREKFEES
eukprot:scaffold7153_cov44-Cylindrotheca_fusiformis.AAC.1